MGKVSYETETMYDKGDIVIFEKDKTLHVGVITGYSLDVNAGCSIWYDIAVNASTTYTYINDGDVLEHDILAKISDDPIINAVTDFMKG